MHTFTPLQTAWLEALESGTILQGNGRLTSLAEGKQYHCCLGVGCVIFNKMAEMLNLVPLPVKEEGNYLRYDRDQYYAPARVAQALGLLSDKGNFHITAELPFKGETTTKYDNLSEMNDAGMSFAEIAKYIRENADNVFRN